MSESESSVLTTEEKVEKVTALVAELAVLDADGIANRIREAGVRGKQGHAQNCPLAVFLTKELGFEVWVNASNWQTLLYSIVVGREAVGDMPNSVDVFVQRIDSGYLEYADLVDGPYYPRDNDLNDEEFTDYDPEF